MDFCHKLFIFHIIQPFTDPSFLNVRMYCFFVLYYEVFVDWNMTNEWTSFFFGLLVLATINLLTDRNLVTWKAVDVLLSLLMQHPHPAVSVHLLPGKHWGWTGCRQHHGSWSGHNRFGPGRTAQQVNILMCWCVVFLIIRPTLIVLWCLMM